MSPFSIRLTFHGDLPFFLGSKASTVERQSSEKTSVKDVIEACGVPHTEVELISVNGVPADFACVVDRAPRSSHPRPAFADARNRPAGLLPAFSGADGTNSRDFAPIRSGLSFGSIYSLPPLQYGA